MSDLISRQAAIDAVYDAFCYAYCDNCEKDMDEELCGDCHRKYQNWSASRAAVEKAINHVPSAQPERKRGRWIPVTERLPEKTGKYLVTVQNGNVYATAYSAMEKKFNCAAVAWMDLPEPYKEEGHDEKKR